MFFQKHFLLAISIASLLIMESCNSKDYSDSILLTGNIAKHESGNLVLFSVDTASSFPIDSVKPDANGNFRLRIDAEVEGFYFFKKGNTVSAIFPAFPGDSIEFAFNPALKAAIRGGRESEIYAQFSSGVASAEAIMDSLSRAMLNARHTPDFAKIRVKTDSAFESIKLDLRKQALDFIDSNPSLLSNVLVINAMPGRGILFDETTDYNHFFRVDSLLQLYHQKNKHAAFFHSRANQLRKRVDAKREAMLSLSPGSLAPEISLPGTSGKVLKLHDKTGKITLIYFWTPTDALSRKSNASLKELYEKYKRYGFTVFAVSFDPFMDRFTNAVNLDKLWWNNVNDTLGMKSPLLSEYQISGFPAFVMIDGQGKIIERFLSDKALSIWLEENLAKADAK